jgi:hypothetical protein
MLIVSVFDGLSGWSEKWVQPVVGDLGRFEVISVRQAGLECAACVRGGSLYFLLSGIAARCLRALEAKENPAGLELLEGVEWKKEFQPERSMPTNVEVARWSKKRGSLYFDGPQRLRNKLLTGWRGVGIVYLKGDRGKESIGHFVCVRCTEEKPGGHADAATMPTPKRRRAAASAATQPRIDSPAVQRQMAANADLAKNKDAFRDVAVVKATEAITRASNSS